MTFDKVKAVEHSEEEVAAEEGEDLKTEEDTSTETGQSEENETAPEEDTSKTEEAEESVEALKARLAKAEQDRDNYKQGLMSAKAKKRTLTNQEPAKQEVDISEQVVVGVLEKQAEKSALRNTIDAKHSDYIPELVDDSNYQEILAYIPRSMDKSDYQSIVKSLKIAVRMWKQDKGIEDKKPAKVNLPSSKTTSAGESKPVAKKTGRTLIGKSQSGMHTWYN